MSRWDGVGTRSVRCEDVHCGAGPGRLCLTKDGRERRSHPSRVAKAVEQRQREVDAAKTERRTTEA